MRPMMPEQAEEAVRVTAPYHRTHGAPVHIGDPGALGVADLDRPDFGDALPMKDGEVPVFWACGVTPQMVMLNARPELAITHAPGYMFVSDLTGASILSCARPVGGSTNCFRSTP